MKQYIFSILGILLFFTSCDYRDFEELDTNAVGKYAIPLIDTEATIIEITDQVNSNAKTQIDKDGKVTIIYQGNTERRTARDVFPVISGALWNLLVLDSVGPIQLPLDIFPDNFQLNKAIFQGVNLFWEFESTIEEDITINITIPELSKNGVVYTEEFLLEYNGTSPSKVTTAFYDVDGYDMEATNNALTVRYTALRPSGERIVLDYCELKLDFFDFSYIEGFFGREINHIEGDLITVGVYSNWVSGGLWFENPNVTMRIQNSFGFPVKAQFNEAKFTNVLNEEYDMESQLIDDGLFFSYPTLSEIGETKYDTFVFNSTNSNVQQIFNEKVKQVTYDIDAVGNPDDDPSIIGFMTSDSYYEVSIEVEMPLLGSANKLLLTDTFDLDMSEFSDVAAAEFKLITDNDFPFDLELQAYFLSKNDEVRDSLFKEGSILIEAASIEPDGTATSKGDVIRLVDINQARFTRITESTKLVFVARLLSLNNGAESVWVYDDYALKLRLGAILDLNKG